MAHPPRSYGYRACGIASGIAQLPVGIPTVSRAFRHENSRGVVITPVASRARVPSCSFIVTDTHTTVSLVTIEAIEATRLPARNPGTQH